MAEVEFYADIFFAVNSVMQTVVFLIVKKIYKRGRVLTIVLVSLVSSFLYCLSMLNAGLNVAVGLILLGASIQVIFMPKSIKQYLKFLLATLVVTFGVGGICFAVYYSNIFNEIDVSLKVLIGSAVIAYIVIKLLLSWNKNNLVKKQTIHRIQIYFNDEHIEIEALLDTGCELIEPAQNIPAIVCEYEAVQKLLPQSLRDIFINNEDQRLEMVAECVSETSMVARIRFIPFKSIGASHGMLIGFKPDYIIIDQQKFVKDIAVAIFNQKLSSDGSYNALMGTHLFRGDM